MKRNFVTSVVGIMVTLISVSAAYAQKQISHIDTNGYATGIDVDSNGRMYAAIEFNDAKVYEVKGDSVNNPILLGTITGAGNDRNVYVSPFDEAYVAGGYVGALSINESSFNTETQVQFSDQVVDIWVSNNGRHFAAIWNSGFAEFTYDGKVLWEHDTWTTYGITGYDNTLVVLDTNPAVQLWDVSESSPNFLGGWGNTASNSAVYNGYLYVTMRGEGVVKLDVSDPTNIQVVAETHETVDARGIHVEAGRVFVADGDVKIFDENLNLIETLYTEGDANDLDMFGAGHYLAVADGDSGVLIYDVTLPSEEEEPVDDNTPSYEDGYTAGYEVGYNDGFAAGVESVPACVQEITNADLTAAHDSGFSEGVASVPACVQTYTDEDITEAHDKGYSEGIVAGKASVQFPKGFEICKDLKGLTPYQKIRVRHLCKKMERTLKRIERVSTEKKHTCKIGGRHHNRHHRTWNPHHYRTFYGHMGH